MSAAGEFIDRALQREGAWYRADEMRREHGGGAGVRLQFYGSSVGAVRAQSVMHSAVTPTWRTMTSPR